MLKVFISYAHEDEFYKKELEKRLIPFLRDSALIESWSDGEILGGEEWDQAIKQEIENSQVILFLVSPDFIASEYIQDVEINKALDRYRKGEVIIIPIILRPTDYSDLEISRFQALPKDGKPISTWKDQDEAWYDVSIQLKRIFESLHNGNIKLKESANISASRSIPSPANDNTSLTNDIRDKIANARTNEALQMLLGMPGIKNNQELYSQVILLMGRNKSLERKAIMGLLSNNDITISRNQINYSILSLLSELESV